LKIHFSKSGALHSATVAKKRDPKREGEMLSMGYGFVQFRQVI
jgi:multiple RNA-binding domain-containing protein 1